MNQIRSLTLSLHEMRNEMENIKMIITLPG